MTDPKHTEPGVVVTSNDSMCGGLYPVHGSVTHGRTVECCDFCGLPADYEPARTAAEAASRQEVERLREALQDVVSPLAYLQRYAKAEGRQISGQAYAIANDLAFVQDIARAALTASEGGG